MAEEIITTQEARALYQGAETGHDFDHVLRVLALAERLADAEDADRRVLRAAVLLHDIARADEDAIPGSDHALMAADRARSILRDRQVDPETIDAVVHAIGSHRFRGNTSPESLEAKILFDADKLDSIGAIGIARAFAISGKLNQRLWGTADADAVASRDQRNSQHTANAEFVVKLSKIRDRLFTASARRMAQERHAYMADYFARLEREIAGEI